MLQSVIMGPLGRTLGLIIVFAVFSLSAASINGWYLQQADAAVVDNERFDRIVYKETHTRADDAWNAAVAVVTNPTVPYGSQNVTPGKNPAADHDIVKIVGDGGKCKVYTSSQVASANHHIRAADAYTPVGTVVKIPALTNAQVTGSGSIKKAFISNCQWQEAGAIFGAGGLSGLVALILQAAGLGLPIGALIGLASFGASFVNKLGGSPIIAAIVMVIGFLLIGTLLNVLTPFVNDAFAAINGDRFLMYDEGIGTLSNVISNFFAVVLVGGLIYVAWSAIQQFRSAGTSSQSMFGGMSERKM